MATNAIEHACESDMPEFMRRTVDVDAHEMVPSHLWEQEFGPAAGKIAVLVEPGLKRFGGNDFYSPEYPGDVQEMNFENVWDIRGARAPGAVDMARRLEAMDVMGTDRQLVFPSFAIFASMFVTAGEFWLKDIMGVDLPAEEARKLGLDAMAEYNEWAARATQIDPHRVRGVGYVLANKPLPEVIKDIDALLAKGIRAIHLPCGFAPGGVSPAATEMDAVYARLTEANVPLLFHIGGESALLRESVWGRAPAFKPGKTESHELGLEPYSMSILHLPICNYMSAMILGGVLERHPTLAVGAIEMGAHWVGHLAENLDMWATKVHRNRLKPFISMLPSEYMSRNFRATPFNNVENVDEFIERYPQVADCYVYSTDYPHIEGGKNIKRVFYDRMKRLGNETMEKFFVTNPGLLVPA